MRQPGDTTTTLVEASNQDLVKTNGSNAWKAFILTTRLLALLAFFSKIDQKERVRMLRKAIPNLTIAWLQKDRLNFASAVHVTLRIHYSYTTALCTTSTATAILLAIHRESSSTRWQRERRIPRSGCGASCSPDASGW